MTNLLYWMTTWTEILFSIITCMSRLHLFCCSDAPTTIAMSILLNMLRPRSLRPHVLFLYYHNITIHASLVSTNDFFFLQNIQDKLKIICGLCNHQTIHSTYSVSIINRKGLCNCVIQTTEIQLIGSHTNYSSNGNFLI